jgi:predicted negative regulator of RcsB-dependent stress response
MWDSGFLFALLLASQFQVAGEVTPARLFRSVEIESIDRRFVDYGMIYADGSFQFKKIPEGLYKITISSQDGRQEQRTIEVRPAFADSRGRIVVKIEVPGARTPTDPFKVGVAALAVSPKAADELQRAYVARGDIEQARQHLQKAIDISPNFAEALNNLGTIYYHKRDFAKAAELFQRGVAANPDFYPAQVNLGGALISLGEYDHALAANLKAVEMRPNDSLAQAQLGQTFFHLKRYDEALAHLETAKRIDPMSFAFPGIFIAQIHQARGDRNAAIAAYDEFLHAHPASDYTDWIEQQLVLLRR